MYKKYFVLQSQAFWSMWILDFDAYDDVIKW